MNLQHLIILFIISLILNTILFSLIYLGYFGNNIKNRFKNLITQRKNLMTVLIFIICFIIIHYLNNPVYLEDNMIITAKIEGNAKQFSGETINAIFYQLGTAGVFTAGASSKTTFIFTT
jgi:hypothetical protein